jgi:hypothetical protein
MKSDLIESMMIIANKDLNEFEQIKKLSTEMFLIKYKIFIDDLATQKDG